MSETKSENDYYTDENDEEDENEEVEEDDDDEVVGEKYKNVKESNNPFSKLESKMKVMTTVNDTDSDGGNEDGDLDDDVEDDMDDDEDDENGVSDEEDEGDIRDEDDEDERDDDEDDDTDESKIKSTLYLDGKVLEDEGEEDEEEEELVKADDSLLKSYILEQKNYMKLFHPECSSISFDEVKTLSVVIRNSFGVVIDHLHRTIPILTKYEKARIIGLRTYHLDDGDEPYISDVRLIAGMSNSDIALLELKMKLLPYIVRRPFPDGKFEYWKLTDLEFLS
jgi:DNA-directed RNA polymerase subunit K/omega